ncbi:long-chain-fatty-acid--CoA ligase [Luteithermobacter gelatinilyticus]|uniref:long-chain-fatty-acid--CoA ligase n=1 Tax=Luteithermobacter gelatinilyticus TaxID=2582913 RepID=UPI00110596CD|nr:long-chain-fatty-acid--CoA ligase [Luteithermobacter gelatinilyticus]|tara:strand:- start:4910 stop:6544 length:1635 start_codon:yes stop_codon:yes gene_type:complete
MMGLMQDHPLLISSLLRHAERYHADSEIVSKAIEGGIHRTTYGEMGRRAAQLAHAMTRLGLKQGECVGTIAWNSYRHMELYYGISGMGAILNTINPRLFPEQLSYIINHAECRYLFVDLTFVPLLEKLEPELKQVKAVVIMTDKLHMPESSLSRTVCYEELIAPEETHFDWPTLDENTASSLCYTSGTTGHPKGVLYSHRSTILHAYGLSTKDAMNIGRRDSVLPIVPMFHVNAWGTPYAGALTGAKLVFPGDDMGGANILSLLEKEGCTLALGVPTVWLALIQHVRKQGREDLSSLPIQSFVVGGSAAPQSMIRDLEKIFGATVNQAWGMTEMSPLGTVNRLLPKHDHLDEEEKMALKLKQGRPVFGVEMKIVDDEGRELPHDGKSFGRLMVRGPWITKSYYKQEDKTILDDDGYFDTGDVSTLDADGYMNIVDRSKDVIKSGGEWISSIDLENIAMGHPDIAEAAVIGLPHPKWQERPLLICVAARDPAPEAEEILSYMESRVAKWWLPDEVVFIEKMPHTATGKVLKTALREMFKGKTLGE